jgi:glycosyltransferase involved in cell wall biosynthesis
MPLVSIVIPCYNHGQFIVDAIQSVKNQTFKDFETIIVNDGSTDTYTNNLLNNLDIPGTRVLSTSNQGLASARNNGILNARGKIILPLDSDDKIHPHYVEKAVNVFNSDPSIRLVYCITQLFGDKKGQWILPDFSIENLMLANLFMPSSFFYREDWEKVKGFNPNMVYGGEDWDFWLSLAELGIKVYKIPEVLFYYRVRKGSMMKSVSFENRINLRSRLYRNHQKLFHDNIEVLFRHLALSERPLLQKIKDEHPLRYIIRRIKLLFRSSP